VIGFSRIVSSTIIGNQTIAYNPSASEAHERINSGYLVAARFHCHFPNTSLDAGNLQQSTALQGLIALPLLLLIAYFTT
jgi:hypothetical protein